VGSSPSHSDIDHLIEKAPIVVILFSNHTAAPYYEGCS
jgi:hypothetical protein